VQGIRRDIRREKKKGKKGHEKDNKENKCRKRMKLHLETPLWRENRETNKKTPPQAIKCSHDRKD
jgi:hypothetical protein